MDEAHIDATGARDPLILTIDVGSSSVRAAVSDGSGRAVVDWVTRRPYALRATGEGAAEANADELVAYAEGCVDELLDAMKPSGRTVAAVGCDTFWHSLVGVARDGTPTTPVLTWADTRSAQEADELRHTLDAREVHIRTGAGLYANYLPAKLLWLSRSQPGVFKETVWWMSFGEFLYFRLFGERRVSISMASGTGLLDQRRCVWDEQVLHALPIETEQLSHIAEYTKNLPTLAPSYARRWPSLAEIPWYLPLGDGACNNIGSGGVNAEQAVVMVGTSGAIRVVRETDDFGVPEGLWTYRVDGKRIVQGGALSAGGNVFAWLVHTLLATDRESLEDELREVAPDSHGLTVLPFLAGERSPGWRSDAHAAILGMTLATTPADMARATLEGVAYRFGLVFSLLVREIGQVRGIIGSGAGLLHSPAWMEIMTDVLGRTIAASAVEEATCRGAALLALEALGEIDDLSKLPVPLGERCEPRPENTRIYAAATERQERYYRLLLT